MDTTLEIENSKLKEQNTELVKTLQYWKMTAAQRENDKIALMKENNDLRLKLSRFSNTGNVLACNLDTALQSASEKALAHLVRASEEIAGTMELAKAYKRDRQELNETSPRWNMLRGTPLSEKKDKVHRVPPLMMGGQSIQPVVALSRTGLDTIIRRSPATTASQNTNVTMRSMPLRLLQEVYIPLTRVDADNQAQNMDVGGESNNTDDSMEDLGLDDSTEREMEDSQRMSEDPEMEASRLETVREEIEPEEETPLRNRIDNPLEGPSWMLDVPPDNQGSTSKSNLEPDSTTEGEEINSKTPVSVKKRRVSDRLLTPGVRLSCEFSPTVRRRKRSASSPPASPILPTHCSPRRNYKRDSPKGRVLKVVLSKMQPQPAPAPRARRRAASSDAPSPNGATLPGLVVSEDVEGRVSMEAGDGDGDLEQATMNLNIKTERTTGDTPVFRDDETRSRACSSESDSGAEGGAGGAGGRSRRHRKPVVYKEKPLNRKMRR